MLERAVLIRIHIHFSKVVFLFDVSQASLLAAYATRALNHLDAQDSRSTTNSLFLFLVATLVEIRVSSASSGMEVCFHFASYTFSFSTARVGVQTVENCD